MNKKGQGISINVIIVTIIALLVLVLLSFVFSSKFAQFSKGVSDCNEFANHQCQQRGPSCDPGYIKDPSKKCYDGNELDPTAMCCILAQERS